MQSQRLRDCLDADFRRLRAVAGGADLGAAVPSCPGWTLADLLRHVGEVYLYKAECMRLGGHPDQWPPEGLTGEPPLELLDRGYAALAGEFAARRPEEHAFTWYDPDQSVGFWIRDMAQETVVHRVDAELAAGQPVAAIPDDLAADGIDELLVAFVQYDTAAWPDEFAGPLASAGGRTVSMVTPQRSWLLRLTTGGVRVDEPDGRTVSATVEGPAPDVLLWLWSRGGEGATTTGDEESIALLRQVLADVLGNRQQD
jgi:uncharacterized protein (TIGR03083 family)